MEISNSPTSAQKIINKFAAKDVASGEPYFAYLKGNDGMNHIFSNVADEKNLELIFMEMVRLFKEWVEKSKQKGFFEK